MKTPSNDETLVAIYARTYGWLIASVRPGERDGAAEVVDAFRRDGSIPYHVEHGTRREREAVLRELANDGLIVVSGNTQARCVALTWPGICRAVALTVESSELPKAFKIMRRVVGHAEDAGGPDVSPAGSVPEYLLAPMLGVWWADCAPAKQDMMLARGRLFCEALPALSMRWLHVSSDCYGRRWFNLTDAGTKALENPPAIPRGLPKKPTLTDFYLSEMDLAFDAACRATPRDGNAVFVPVPASRWWEVRTAVCTPPRYASYSTHLPKGGAT